MKLNRVFKLASLVIVLCIVGGSGLLQGCKKDVEPIYYMYEAIHRVEFIVVDSETKFPLSDVVVNQTHPDGSSDILNLIDDVLSINVKSREAADLVLNFDKDGFIPNSKIILFDIRELASRSDWFYTFTVMLTKVNEPVSVNPKEESLVEVEESDATVIFPLGCVTEAVDVYITEVPAAAEVAVTSQELELTEGRIALKAFTFLPEGQTFEIPIEITFPIPNETTNYVFARWLDGEWETIAVVNNGDGTGTAFVSDLSDYILTTEDVWVYEESILSDEIIFTGDCDKELVANIEKSFDSDETVAKDDLFVRIQTSFSETKIGERRLGYKRNLCGEYTIRNLKNTTKGYSIQIPSLPVVWTCAGETTCHTGGSGN
jgi:hypothetical protein